MRALRLPAVAAGLLLPAAAFSASAATSRFAPGNQPVPGARTMSSLSMTGSGLGMAILAARVSSDGTLVSGAGATGAIHLGSGQYQINFNRDVSGCFYSVTPFARNNVPIAEPKSDNVNEIFVNFAQISQGSDVTDSEFYLTVFCNK